MATFSKKRRSPEPSTNQSVHEDDGSRTPLGSPPKKKLRITQSQKQALIDNLQLEITERARKLRAHYALQAQDLRGRIERRVNRIPISLRKVKMGELLAKHAAAAEADALFKKPTVPGKSTRAAAANTKDTASRTRTAKPANDDHGLSDKENAPYHDTSSAAISNPKMRGAAKATAGQSRPSQLAESKILSPKSSNSRTFPQSPLHKSPVKQQQPAYRPVSPLKHGSPVKNATDSLAGMVENARTRGTRGATTAGRKVTSKQEGEPATATTGRPGRPASRTKNATTKTTTATSSTRRAGAATTSRPATRQQNTRQVSSSTTSSNTSSGTTIVKRAAPGTRKATAPTTTKKPAVPAAAKKTTASAARKAQTVEQPAPGRRVLRKRA